MSGSWPPFGLGHPETPLERLLSRLGLPPGAFTEELGRIVIKKDEVAVPAGLVDTHKATLVELTEEYGDALESSFIDTLYGPILLAPGLTEQGIEEILAENRRTLGASFRKHLFPLQIIIDKRRVLEICLEQARLPLPPAVECLYFFDLGTFVRELSKPTAALERWWRGQPCSRLVVFVPHWEGPSMPGPFLSLIGGDYADAVPRLTPQPVERGALTVLKPASPVEESPRKEATGKGPWIRFRDWVQETLLPDAAFEPPPEPVPASETVPETEKTAALSPEALVAARVEKVSWEKQWLKFLTPLHLQVKDDGRSGDPVAELLRLHRVNLSILFTADRVQELADGSLQAFYQTPEMAVAVKLADPGHDRSAIGAASTNDLTGIALGFYDGSFKDRIVRSTMGAFLKAEEPDRRFELLAGRGAALLEEIQISSLVFLRQELDQFMDQVQVLEDYVAGTVQAFSNQASEMIKSLSETMLAAVAVLLGSFVGALLQKDFDSRVLVIGAALYLLYLVVFPLSYNMGQRKDSYQALAAQFEARRRLFYRRLYREKVDQIVGDHVDRIRERFEYWFRRTLLTYWFVAALLAVFIIFMW